MLKASSGGSVADRYLPAVLDKVLQVIPAGEGLLRLQLEKVKTSAMYTPPESMHYQWSRAAVILNEHLNWPPEEDWEKNVFVTFTGQAALP
jgi:hypothetical protein